MPMIEKKLKGLSFREVSAARNEIDSDPDIYQIIKQPPTWKAFTEPCQKGFTLIEVVLSILLLGIISGIVAMVLMEGIGGWAAVGPRKEAMSGLRPAVERMVREIREGRRYNYSIPTSDTLNFSIYTSATDPGRNISYSCAAGQRIDRTEGGTPNTLIDNVSFCNFSTISPNLIGVLARSTVSGNTIELREVAFMRNYTGQP